MGRVERARVRFCFVLNGVAGFEIARTSLEISSLGLFLNL